MSNFVPVGIDAEGRLPREAREALAAEVADSSTELGASLNATFGRHLLNVADYLDGAPMPTATTGDMGAPLLAALADAQALADADPDGTYLVGLPAGKFRVTTEVRTDWARSWERIGVRGAGMLDTVLMPVGGISMFVIVNTAQTPGSLSEYAAEDCTWADFTVDMRGATAPDPTGASYKHFKGAGWRACRFENVYGVGSPATGFGNDYLVDCVFESCVARDAGRANPEPIDYYANGSRSGFGIATGWSEDESAQFINCHAIDNKRSGFLFEWQHQFSTTQRQRFTLIGCTASGNYVGLTNAGADVTKAIGCKFNDNEVAGVYVGPNEASPVAGRNVELDGCELRGNRFGVLATSVQAWVFGPQDANPVPSSGGLRILNSDIANNTEHGVYLRQMALGPGGVRIDGNRFADNGGSAVRMERAFGDFEDVHVTGNDFAGTGRHLDLLVPLTSPTVRDNAFRGGTVGIAYHPALNATDAIQGGNTFYGVDTPVQVGAGVLASPAQDRIATPAQFTHHESFMAASAFPTAGWLNADLHGTEATWTVSANAGIQPAGTSGQDALAYRAMGTTGTYAEIWLRQATLSQSPARLAVVSYTGPDDDPHETGKIRNFVGAGVRGALSNFYALWKFRTSTTGMPTLLWESNVPITEPRVVGVRRVEGSTVTQMFIDGELVHEMDVPDVPPTQYAGIYGEVTASQNRRIPFVNLQALGTTPEPPPLYGDSGAGAAGDLSGSSLLDGSDTSKKWTTLGGAGWERTGTGAMKPVSGTSTGANIDTGAATGRVGATIEALSGGTPLIAVLARATGDINNFIWFGPSQTGIYRLAHRDAGSTTVLWDSSIAPAVGDKFGIEILDETTIRVLVNEVVVQEVAASSALAALSAGVWWGMYGHFGVDPVSSIKDWYWNPA